MEQQSLLQTIAPHLLEIGGALLSFGIAWLAAAVKRYLDSKAKSTIANASLQFVSSMAFDVVSGLEQAVVRELKIALADGKLTKEEYDAALASLRDQAVEIVTKSAKAHFGKALGSAANTIATHAEHAVEAAVAAQGHTTPAPSPASNDAVSKPVDPTLP